MALGVQEEQKNTLYLLAAILIHETLAGFALGSNMVRNGTSACLLCFYSSVFSVMIPIGIVIGLAINGNKSFPAEVASATTQALAAGVFIFITFLKYLDTNLTSNRIGC
ncbi:putative zinc transporter ZIP3-like [Apostichopus japonicus]|uniref:Zinc transporter ZIP3 n=1 Tax=Stichopus japonicus TaxID=307972 RepID=A0A2G8JNT9_STIJA|nr:putative zinc transporter ZIP3-like [Apostichopus japonicus]